MYENIGKEDDSNWLTTDKICVKECNWGEKIIDEAIINVEYDLIILSDLVFIAVRDSIMDEFINTILQIVKSPKTKMLLIYEERILEGEEEFLNILKRYFTLKMIELDTELLDWLDNPSNSINDDDDEGSIGGLFYEKPGIKIFICSLKIKN